LIAVAFAATFGLSTLLKSCGGSSSRSAATGAPPAPMHGATRSPLEKLTVSYTKLNELVAGRRITAATIDTTRGMAELTVKAGEGRTQDLRSFFAGEPDKLANRLAAAGAEVTVRNGRPQMPWPVKMLLWLALGAGFAFLLFRMQRRQKREHGDGGVSGGLRSDARLGTPPAVRFSDVAGCDEVVEEVAEFKEFLVDPTPFRRLGARMPSGVILYGPPGTGKTLVAKALAGEAGASFFAVSGSDFVDRYVGMGASRIRDLFKKARAAAPAIIFIDELDAVGKKRGAGAPGSDAEREQTLNQLLVEMDGFNSKERVVVAAATNRLDTLDEALLRAGRFSRQVQVGLPDKDGRRQILEVHVKGTPLDADVDLDRLAEVTASMSGATLADLVNEAAIMAARAKRTTVTQADLEEGQLRALAGPEKKNRTLSEEERELIAYHEAGHVLCAELSAEHEKAQRATIKPRGQAAGLAVYGQTDRAIHSARYLHERMLCALGGRAAEWVRYGKVSSGAANDLEQVNRLARHAVEELGFSAATGQITLSGARGQASDRTREVIDAEVERILAEAYAEAVHHLEAHRAKLDSLATALLACEDLSRIEIVAALAAADGGEQLPHTRPRALAPTTAPVLHRPAPAPPAVQPPHPPRLRDVVAERLRSSGRRRLRPSPAPVAAAQSMGGADPR
jgi:cell division protease FtsH